MYSDGFVSLHTHSYHSLLDGLSSPEEYLKRAAELGQPALGLSDHGHLGAAYDLYQGSKQLGIKPIIGLEAYQAPEDMGVREKRFIGPKETWGNKEVQPSQGAYFHATLMAKNPAGLRNLYKLHYETYARGYYYDPRFDFECLAEHAEGLIVGSGCAGSMTSKYVRQGSIDKAVESAETFADIVGHENTFIEIMDHELPFEPQLNAGLQEVAKRTGLRVIATNDAHYARPEQAAAHEALLCVQTGAKLSDEKRFHFGGYGYHLMSRAEMLRAGHKPEWLDNTLLVAEMVESYDEVFQSDSSRMPQVENADEVLRQKCYQWTAFKSAEYRQRIEYEFSIIKQMGFSSYFLILASIVDWCREQRIPVGPGRGSAAGSLVSYALGITQVDPMRWGLLFERFLNPDRPGYPDIDVDVSEERRGEVISYIQERFGERNVAQILTLGMIKSRYAIRDAARVLGREQSEADDIAALVPPPKHGRVVPLSEVKFGRLSEDRAEVVALARQLEGTVRSRGVHAAGVVITTCPVYEAQPTWIRDKDTMQITGFDMNIQEKLSCIKMDMLGLRTLDVIRHAEETAGVKVPIGDFEDPEVYRELREGYTDGVFQFEGYAAKRALRDIRATDFADLVAATALCRPGPRAMIPEYAAKKRSNDHTNSIHPELEKAVGPILAETYGILVYQESLMRILVEVCGYSVGQSSTLLKVFKKKDHERLNKEREPFFKRGSERGFSEESLLALWEKVLPFADYAFPKAHAVAYSFLSYQTAWLKVHYPREFMTALLTSVQGESKAAEDKDNKARILNYFGEVARLGIPLLLPDINTSEVDFVLRDGGIQYGLGAIHGMGEAAGEAVLSGRPYADLEDFFMRADRRALNKAPLTSLIKAGALDGLGNRETLLEHVEDWAGGALYTRGLIKDGKRPLVRPTFRAQGGTSAALKRETEAEVLGLPVTTGEVNVEIKRALNTQEWEYLFKALSNHPGWRPVNLSILGLTSLVAGYTVGEAAKVKAALESLGEISVSIDGE